MAVRSSDIRMPRRMSCALFVALATSFLLPISPARAGQVLTPGLVTVDRPTLITLGVQWFISNDDNRNATVSVRYRKQGTTNWLNAMDLFRVHPEDLTPLSVGVVREQFAGSIFNLQPASTYEIELTAHDPDTTLNPLATQTVTATTRAVPPLNPPCLRQVSVSAASGFQAALAGAQAGDCITLAGGTYSGQFVLNRSGTAANPIVIRGTVDPQGNPTSIIDANCVSLPNDCQNPIASGCIALDTHGSYIDVEQLAIQNARRGLWFRDDNTGSPTLPTTGNVARRLVVTNTCIGISSIDVADVAEQTDFYVCDNNLTGVRPWPAIYSDDSGHYSNHVGVRLEGIGHVVCHNRIKAFGDGIKILPTDKRTTTRAYDIYGNDILSGYDNAVELDLAQGNVRVFRNRFLNTLSTLSFQPVIGGPVYAAHNLAVNVAREAMKFSTATVLDPVTNSQVNIDPSGILVFNNTFVSPALINSCKTPVAAALNLINGASTSHNFLIENNLFVGPGNQPTLPGVRWLNQIDDGLFDYNGYFPNQRFLYGSAQESNCQTGALSGSTTTFANLAALQATTDPNFAKFEDSGVDLSQAPDIFEVGPAGSRLQAPTIWSTTVAPETDPDATPDPASNAINTAAVLANINDGFVGTRPDLGTFEAYCSHGKPLYGPRPSGVDETNEAIGCEGTSPAAGLCPPAPVAGCRKSTGTSQLRLLQRSSRKTLLWRWDNGATTPTEFADPTTQATYYFCLYQNAGGSPQLVAEGLIPAAGTNCGSHFSAAPCWVQTSVGYRYKTRTGAPHGIGYLDFRGDAFATSRARIRLKAKSGYLSLPQSLLVGAPVTAQLRRAQTPLCWDATYSVPRLNTESIFLGFADHP
jgi:hypothetical protein